MRTQKKDSCDICGKKTYVSDGWHLKIKQKLLGKQIYLNFCSNLCVAEYIEETMSGYFKDLLKFEKRIKELEKKK